jgi:hypothetical protein
MLLIAIGKLSMMAGVDLLVEQLSADLKYNSTIFKYKTQV